MYRFIVGVFFLVSIRIYEKLCLAIYRSDIFHSHYPYQKLWLPSVITNQELWLPIVITNQKLWLPIIITNQKLWLPNVITNQKLWLPIVTTNHSSNHTVLCAPAEKYYWGCDKSNSEKKIPHGFKKSPACYSVWNKSKQHEKFVYL